MNVGGTGRSLWRAASAGVGIRAACAGLGFLTALILARVLGPDGYGVYALVLAGASLLGIPIQSGIPALALRETAAGLAREDWPGVKALWSWSRRSVLGAALLLGGAVVALAAAWPGDLRPELGRTAIWGIVLVPLVALATLFGSTLRGLDRVLLGQLPELLVRPLIFAGALAVVLLAGGVLTPSLAMALHVVAAATALILGGVLLARSVPDPVRRASRGPVLVGPWTRAALPLALISGMHAVNAHTDVVMLGILTTETDVGVYRVAVQVASVVGFGLLAANMVVSPRVAAHHAAGDAEALQRLATQGARLAMTVAAPAAVLLVAFGGPLLDVAFGTAYRAGSDALTLLALGQVVNAFFGSVGVLLNMTGHEALTLRGVGLAAVLNVALNLLLIPLFGTAGAATATLVTYLAWNLVLWRAVRLRLGVNSLPWPRGVHP